MCQGNPFPSGVWTIRKLSNFNNVLTNRHNTVEFLSKLFHFNKAQFQNLSHREFTDKLSLEILT